MIDYIGNMIDDIPEYMKGKSATPVNTCRMRAVRTEPGLNSRRHISAAKSHGSLFVSSHDHKIINNIFLMITIVSDDLMLCINW